ncbi:recombinase family protein [Novosphingobium beihaiensis]|uniref:Recombinase family protein n=1 Tax=Novosphingobium beihaiensis TaxID=2930389 RepID=A0ABT0BVB7_9SPHN|nr:recombinase family protein [Novosphingobium beihaiensis]MCJ2189025.1 recombinase family protein [Novosphingobium beihaiensis]
MLVGYARVSTTHQSLDVQMAQLFAHGVEKIFQEQMSGKSVSNRPELKAALDFCREGDTFMVTRLDRFARSAQDLHNIVAELTAKGVGFRCLQQGGLDTTTSHGKLMLGILAAVAEFELDIRQERQREGIEKAKASGIYKGGKQRFDPASVIELHSSGMKPRAIAREVGCSPATVYRLLG